MKIGYLCYRLSGTGPRTRAADVINAVAGEPDQEAVVLTNEPEVVTADADVRPVAIDKPVHLLRTARSAFADADVVHVPINVYQALFVRLVYRGPLVGGVGPGLQPSAFHKRLGRLIGVDKKIKVHQWDTQWEEAGYDTAICTATIDTGVFRPYDDDRIAELRGEFGFDDETVVLYVGRLTEHHGAHLVDEAARMAEGDDGLEFVVVGDGPLEDRFEGRENVTFPGFVENRRMPEFYNLADVSTAPRISDNTSNVGLESIACGTPFVTTATGTIEKLFGDREAYRWADRDAESLLAALRELAGDPEAYAAQRERGLRAIEEMPVTIDSALDIHLGVYEELAART
ncbi:glycosyltransferase [Halosimplex rubrum]|uniref:Glycosyltransferase n=1 Tax=Halosimplex rubrum TaxID=869889 RepID=A0A7D5T891_9EURY|nr:glycosyltransferase [Halosimplex rubrum]QLH78915.1 glycosyltransferase [Halosimplex rubrum]